MEKIDNIEQVCDLSLTVSNTQKGYFDEMVIFDYTNELYKYSFSNNLDDMEVAIYARTGCSVKLKNATWRINDNLSVKVRHLMNKHNMKYSMTTYSKDDTDYCVVNMHSGDLWFIARFENTHIKDGEKKYYFDSIYIEIMDYYIKTYSKNNDDNEEE